MAYRNLQEFLALLEKKGELVRVKAETDPVLEISHITDMVSKRRGPALYFENPKGSKYPVVTNLLGSRRRIALALERKDPSMVAREALGLMSMNIPRSMGNILHISHLFT